MMRYAVGIGSNIGDRAGHIAAAAELLMASDQASICASSSLHETAPVGGPPGQNTFLNGAWIIVTALEPRDLLGHLLAIEQRMGRERKEHWGPRTIDLDLLLAEDERVVACPGLRLPHPLLHCRSFVLLPLAEIAAAWRHPLLGCTVSDLCRRLVDVQAGVERSR